MNDPRPPDSIGPYNSHPLGGDPQIPSSTRQQNTANFYSPIETPEMTGACHSPANFGPTFGAPSSSWNPDIPVVAPPKPWNKVITVIKYVLAAVAFLFGLVSLSTAFDPAYSATKSSSVDNILLSLIFLIPSIWFFTCEIIDKMRMSKTGWRIKRFLWLPALGSVAGFIGMIMPLTFAPEEGDILTTGADRSIEMKELDAANACETGVDEMVRDSNNLTGSFEWVDWPKIQIPDSGLGLTNLTGVGNISTKIGIPWKHDITCVVDITPEGAELIMADAEWIQPDSFAESERPAGSMLSQLRAEGVSTYNLTEDSVVITSEEICSARGNGVEHHDLLDVVADHMTMWSLSEQDQFMELTYSNFCPNFS